MIDEAAVSESLTENIQTRLQLTKYNNATGGQSLTDNNFEYVWHRKTIIYPNKSKKSF